MQSIESVLAVYDLSRYLQRLPRTSALLRSTWATSPFTVRTDLDFLEMGLSLSTIWLSCKSLISILQQSVRPSVCHTPYPRLTVQHYRNAVCTVRWSDVRCAVSLRYAELLVTFTPTEATGELRRGLKGKMGAVQPCGEVPDGAPGAMGISCNVMAHGRLSPRTRGAFSCRTAARLP